MSEQDPLSPAERQYRVGENCLEFGDPDGAIDALTEALRLDPSHARAYLRRGQAHGQRDEVKHALTDLDTAVRLDPALAEAYLLRALVHQRMGLADQALDDLSTHISLTPTDSRIYSLRGTLYRMIGRLDEALADLDKAVHLAPDDAGAYNERGLIRLHRGDFDECLVDLNRALELDPNCGQAYCNRGMIWSRQGDGVRARADFDRAIECDGHDVSALVNRGVLLAAEGERESALGDLERALALDPSLRVRIDRIIYDFRLRESGDTATPIDEIELDDLAERTRRASLILAGQVVGSRRQAQAFMNWLETYRVRVVMPWDTKWMDLMMGTLPGPRADVDLPGVRPAAWFVERDPDYAFACTLGVGGQFRIPHGASPVPDVTDFEER